MRILIATLLIATLSACGAENDNRRTGNGNYIYPSGQGIETEDGTQKRVYTDGVIDMSADQRSMDRSADATGVVAQDDMGLTAEDETSGAGGAGEEISEAIGEEFTTGPDGAEETEEVPADGDDISAEPQGEDEPSVDEFGAEELSGEELMVEGGAVLYADNCAGCHNELAATTKSGRAAEHILEALATVNKMSAVGPFTAEEIDQLVAALDFTE